MAVGIAGGSSVAADELVACEYLEVADLCKIFGIGMSKARMFMDLLPHTRIGRKYYVRRADLDAYMREHDAIDFSWPKHGRR